MGAALPSGHIALACEDVAWRRRARAVRPCAGVAEEAWLPRPHWALAGLAGKHKHYTMPYSARPPEARTTGLTWRSVPSPSMLAHYSDLVQLVLHSVGGGWRSHVAVI